MSRKTLEILSCPMHGYSAISIGDPDGGLRVTPSKCCGQWRATKTFAMSSRDWETLAEKAREAAAEAAEHEAHDPGFAPNPDDHAATVKQKEEEIAAAETKVRLLRTELESMRAGFDEFHRRQAKRAARAAKRAAKGEVRP